MPMLTFKTLLFDDGFNSQVEEIRKNIADNLEYISKSGVPLADMFDNMEKIINKDDK